MIFHTRTVLTSTSPDHDHGMLLHIMSYSHKHRSQLRLFYWNSPSPGIYAVTSMPLLNLHLAIFLSPELGFLGFVMPTRRHTPFIAGLCTSCGETFLRAFWPTRHPLSTWLKVASCDGVEANVRRKPLKCENVVGDDICCRIDGEGTCRRRRRNVSGILAIFCWWTDNSSRRMDSSSQRKNCQDISLRFSHTTCRSQPCDRLIVIGIIDDRIVEFWIHLMPCSLIIRRIPEVFYLGVAAIGQFS